LWSRALSEVEKAGARRDLVSIESDILVVEKGAQEILAASNENRLRHRPGKKGIEADFCAATEADKAAQRAAPLKQQAKEPRTWPPPSKRSLLSRMNFRAQRKGAPP